MKRTFLVAGIFALMLLTFATPAAASFSGYNVGPAYGATGTPASDLAPITFWNLSLREMTIVLALSFCPIVIFPVEIFFACKIYACLGFRRIFTGNILENSTRNDIYRIIRTTPGIRFPALLQQMKISRGALCYHLGLLATQRKIVALKANGSTSYVENNGEFSSLEQKILSCLGHKTERRILHLLLVSPGCTRTDIGRELAVSGPTVTWYMKRLMGDGILRIQKDGRFSRYSLTGDASGCLSRVSGMPLPGCSTRSRMATTASAAL